MFFDSRELQEHWFEQILRKQRFWDARITQFKILRLLGEGSFGKVFLSQHVNTLLYFAVKIVDKRKVDAFHAKHGEPYLECELVESLTAANCKNVPKCYDTFADDTRYYIVTDYADGGDLLHYLTSVDDHPTDEDVARRIIK